MINKVLKKIQKKTLIKALLYSVIFCTYFIYLLAQKDNLLFTTHQDRDILRAEDIFQNKLGIIGGSDTSGQGRLPGPAFYFLIQVGKLISNDWQYPFYSLLILSSLSVLFLSIYICEIVGLAALAIILSGFFFNHFYLNQIFSFFNPSYTTLFIILNLIIFRFYSTSVPNKYLALFLNTLIIGTGIQIHGQYIFLVISNIIIFFHKNKFNLKTVVLMIFALISPLLFAYIFFLMKKYELIDCDFTPFSQTDILLLFKKSFRSPKSIIDCIMRIFFFHSALIFCTISCFIMKVNPLRRLSSDLFFQACLITFLVSLPGSLSYFFSGSAGRYGIVNYISGLCLAAIIFQIEIVVKIGWKKIYPSMLAIIVLFASYKSAPEIIKNNFNFVELNLKENLFIYETTNYLTGLNGAELKEKIFNLNTDLYQLPFHFFSKFKPNKSYQPLNNKNISFFLYHNKTNEEYTSEWITKMLPNFLPKIISDSISNAEITILPAIISGKIWLIPYYYSSESRFPHGFSNQTALYIPVSDYHKLFLKIKNTQTEKKIAIQNNKIEGYFQWNFCIEKNTPYCIFSQRVSLIHKSKNKSKVIVSTVSPGLANNASANPYFTYFMDKARIKVTCGNSYTIDFPIEYIGAKFGEVSADNDLKQIMSPFEFSETIPCILQNITSITTSYRLTNRGYNWLRDVKETIYK